MATVLIPVPERKMSLLILPLRVAAGSILLEDKRHQLSCRDNYFNFYLHYLTVYGWLSHTEVGSLGLRVWGLRVRVSGFVDCT